MAPSTEDRVKALKVKRSAFVMELQDLTEILEHADNHTKIREIQLRLEELNAEYLTFAKTQPELDITDDGQLLRDRINIKSFYTQLKARALDLIAENTPTTTSTVAQAARSDQPPSPLSQVESVDSEIQLPKINLPIFSGNYEDWPGFSDQFKSSVHENSRLSDCKKLMYLRSCLKAEAYQSIESLSNSAANYNVAWALLDKRYNQPAVIVANHLQALFELSNVARPEHRELRAFLTKVEAHYRALQPLNQPTTDTLMIHLLLSKVDKATSLKWREYTRETQFPRLETFFEFLHERCQILEPYNSQAQPHQNPNNSGQRNQTLQQRNFRYNFRDTRPSPAQAYATQVVVTCSFCKGTHYSQQCENFVKLTVEERFQLVKSKKLCSNCLKGNHQTADCRSTTCKKCCKKHHTMLHRDTNQGNANPPVQANISCLNSHFSSEIFLAKAIIELIDNSGQPHPCRVLLDSCSHAHFLSHKFVKQLDLDQQRTNIPLSGTNNMSSTIVSQTTANIKSRFNNFSKSLTFLIVDKVSQKIPTINIERKDMNIPQNLPLADSRFHESAEVDGSLGAQIFWDLLSVGCIQLPHTDAKLHKTKLGWVVVGQLINQHRHKSSITCNLITNSLEQEISKFWEIEERSMIKHQSVEEAACEAHYHQHTVRDAGSGKYIVKLPFKDNLDELGKSYPIALKRFLAIERQLNKNPNVKSQYCEFMKEYLELGHMSPCEPDQFNGYFLPHHAVIKSGSLTTKVRFVFDASAKTSSGLSLNDTLMVGATVQDELFDLVLRFRTHKYALTADIAKMYRQISLAPEDKKFHKILWREQPNEPIRIFQLNTVTYGTACAPFLATRTLIQLAIDEGNKYPLASQVVKNDFYVDDLLTGAATLQEAETLRDELIALTSSGGFQLRQWASNNSELLKPFIYSNDEHMVLNLSDKKKTLGLFWQPHTDTIGYTVRKNASPTRLSKREMLSRIASLFDPLGLLGPVIVKAKILMQELWKLNLHWDESVPMNIHSMWTEFEGDLPLIESFKVPRFISHNQPLFLEVHGFADASERAYGACLYLRSSDNHGHHNIHLICSKSRVAPLKVQSLPRLELCAALLLTTLYKSTVTALKLKINDVHFWTDSMITLHWIRTSPHTLKQFIANRVSEIQQNTNIDQWRHVPSNDNPADILSRGSNPSTLLESSIWINGPSWLNYDSCFWPTTTLTPLSIPEQRPVTTLATVRKVSFHSEILHKFSTITKLTRAIAYCYRFYNHSSRKIKTVGPLTIPELDCAHDLIIKLTQKEALQSEIDTLRQETGSLQRGHLLALKPFIDSTGILRVGGRLTNSNLSYDHKHPILLPNKHTVTDLISKHYHILHGHAGTQNTLNAIRQKYWIIHGKMAVKRVIHKCIPCFRANPSIPTYKVGDLPKDRVTFTRPFLKVGVDYCGPFFIKERKLRNIKKIKAYISVFVCLATKAIHLELVGDLTTDTFIAALRRLLARRGKATDLYSDNATNFIGANRSFKELYDVIFSESKNDIVRQYLTSQRINWHFIPPRAPHFGGIWESAVKSVKHHTTRIMQKTLLTHEAFTTCLVEIEAILNSRPITPLSSDPTDLTALTPGHFIIGDSLMSIPERDFTETKTGRLSSWQQIQQIRQHFWKRWHQEYLNELTVRQKWHRAGTPDVQQGTLVILKEDNLPPLCWPLARITQIHPGEDGIVRVVTVKTTQGTYKRAIKKLAPLPIDVANTSTIDKL